ncbi:hypothetical protein L195_g031256 [Trifolium pratense]|uniref:Uncharacterized protein n=1 Tax=Trifolium pratense TaxID=57577 RepID=A0A2K3L9V6_TRIPR|nr:hypothetical protein L195_g031256 [Trifolium pratense]
MTMTIERVFCNNGESAVNMRTYLAKKVDSQWERAAVTTQWETEGLSDGKENVMMLGFVIF